jgi:indole-3-acetate monooxygenase
VPSLAALSIGSITVGIARGALDDILALASGKTPLLADSTLAATANFQFELAYAETQLRAARGLLYETADSLWETAAAGSPLSLEQRARIRATACGRRSRPPRW